MTCERSSTQKFLFSSNNGSAPGQTAANDMANFDPPMTDGNQSSLAVDSR